MINTIWVYIGSIIGSALVIFFILFLGNSIYNYFLFRKLKMNVPIDKKELADAGKASPIIEKEVEKDERTKLDKHRQFEQLRFLAERERGVTNKDDIIAGIKREHERLDVSDQPADSTTNLKPNNGKQVIFD